MSETSLDRIGIPVHVEARASRRISGSTLHEQISFKTYGNAGKHPCKYCIGQQYYKQILMKANRDHRECVTFSGAEEVAIDTGWRSGSTHRFIAYRTDKVGSDNYSMWHQSKLIIM